MKVKQVEDKEQVNFIRAKLKENEGYCPCVINSIGKEEYKCPCKDFRENTPKGDICHCGLYMKVKE